MENTNYICKNLASWRNTITGYILLITRISITETITINKKWAGVTKSPWKKIIITDQRMSDRETTRATGYFDIDNDPKIRYTQTCMHMYVYTCTCMNKCMCVCDNDITGTRPCRVVVIVLVKGGLLFTSIKVAGSSSFSRTNSASDE